MRSIGGSEPLGGADGGEMLRLHERLRGDGCGCHHYALLIQRSSDWVGYSIVGEALVSEPEQAFADGIADRLQALPAAVLPHRPVFENHPDAERIVSDGVDVLLPFDASNARPRRQVEPLDVQSLGDLDGIDAAHEGQLTQAAMEWGPELLRRMSSPARSGERKTCAQACLPSLERGLRPMGTASRRARGEELFPTSRDGEAGVEDVESLWGVVATQERAIDWREVR